MRYLLDTNTFIAAMKGTEKVRTKLAETPLSSLILSPVVLGELQLGVEKSQHRQKNAERLTHIVADIALAPIDAETSRYYGEIRAALEKDGQPIGGNDYWIAAQGKALDAVVVTDNVSEFSRIEGLRVENWLER